MKNIWCDKWKKCFIWFGSYFSFIALAIVGGYTIVKSESEELKKTTKTAFIVCLIFAAISAFLTIFYSFASMSGNYSGSAASSFYNIASKIVSVAKIVVYAIFIIIELVKKDKTQSNE